MLPSAASGAALPPVAATRPGAGTTARPRRCRPWRTLGHGFGIVEHDARLVTGGGGGVALCAVLSVCGQTYSSRASAFPVAGFFLVRFQEVAQRFSWCTQPKTVVMMRHRQGSSSSCPRGPLAFDVRE